MLISQVVFPSMYAHISSCISKVSKKYEHGECSICITIMFMNWLKQFTIDKLDIHFRLSKEIVGSGPYIYVRKPCAS